MSATAALQTVPVAAAKSGNGASLLQRKCGCGVSASYLTGECEDCGTKKRWGLQTKLKLDEPDDRQEQKEDAPLQAKLRIGEPNDRYEAEADRVADAIMASSDPAHERAVSLGPALQSSAHGGSRAAPAGLNPIPELVVQRLIISAVPPAHIQREATESCSAKEEITEEDKKEEAEESEATGEGELMGKEEEGAEQKTLQPKGRVQGVATPVDLEARIDASRGRGTTLSRSTREFMESRFGYDFSAVRVHTDGSAQRLNREVRSLAFTSGTDIYFAPGQFQPGTNAGKHLLAHELTHVIQQAGGGGGMVREKADPRTIARAPDDADRPRYYSHKVAGTIVHNLLERILRAANPDNLVTEARVPGADRKLPELNRIGIADLYASTPAFTVSGVKGLRKVDKEEDVIAMNNPKGKNAVTEPLAQIKSWPKLARPKGGGERGWAGDFPSEVLFGEIKPLSVKKVEQGEWQLQSYEKGYRDFVERVHTLNSGQTRSTIATGRLAITLPPRLDFDMWPSEHAKPARDTEFGKTIPPAKPGGTSRKERRMWVAALGNGMYVYFDLATDPGAPPTTWYREQIETMRALRQSVTNKNLVAGPTPMGQAKFLPGSPRPVISRSPRGTGTRRLQRYTKDRLANYWPDRGREWEQKRSTWGKGFRTTLKEKYKSYREKLRTEKSLGRMGRSAPAPERKEVKEYGQLMFWSGYGGRFLGKVRFLLGTAWDKSIGVFERMKEKMSGVRERVRATPESSVLPAGGWRRKLIGILVRVAKTAVAKFITESFNFFASCFHSAMHKVMETIQTEITETLAVQLCKKRKLFEDSKARLETEWGVSVQKLEELVKTIQSAKHWFDIATGAISLIRLGVQVVACLTPPGLGCLWGLVAQLAIGEALDLIVGSPWFNKNIVTPTVGDLVRKYATPTYQRLINNALGEDLKEYHCKIPEGAPFPQLDLAVTGGLSDAELVARRDAWEATHQEQMLKDLGVVFEKGKGKKVTKEELLELAEQIKKGNKPKEQIEAMLEQARNPATGKLRYEVAKANVIKGEAPELAPKERKIDYEHAKRRNVSLQKTLGWDPLTFYKKPGVSVASEEFADAVYDMQEALRINADGIFGHETLIAFYDRNKLKKDRAYEEALRIRGEKKAAKEKLAEEQSERDRVAAARSALGPKASDSDVIALPVGKPAPGTPACEPAWTTLPRGVIKPDLGGRASYDAGESVTINVRYWIDGKWVWFTSIPAEFMSISTYLGARVALVRVSEEFYFKVARDETRVYVFKPVITKGAGKGIVID